MTSPDSPSLSRGTPENQSWGKCPTCDGKGHVEIERQRNVNYTWGVCKTCQGVGRLRAPALSEGEPTPAQISGVTWLLIRDGRVLMEKCPKKAAKLGVGEWFIPGGKIEDDESAEQTLLREIGEEWPGVTVLGSTRLPIVQGSPIGVDVDGAFLIQPFLITAHGEIPTCSADGIDLKWTPLSEALASPVPQVRMMVVAAIPPASPLPDSPGLSEMLDRFEKAGVERSIARNAIHRGSSLEELFRVQQNELNRVSAMVGRYQEGIAKLGAIVEGK